MRCCGTYAVNNSVTVVSKRSINRQFTYFAREGPDGLIKIGKSFDPPGRFASLQTGSPRHLTLLGVIQFSDTLTEATIHERFAHLRVRGEWFTPGSDLLEFITAQAKPWTNELKVEAIRHELLEKTVLVMRRRAGVRSARPLTSKTSSEAPVLTKQIEIMARPLTVSFIRSAVRISFRELQSVVRAAIQPAACMCLREPSNLAHKEAIDALYKKERALVGVKGFECLLVEALLVENNQFSSLSITGTDRLRALEQEYPQAVEEWLVRARRIIRERQQVLYIVPS